MNITPTYTNNLTDPPMELRSGDAGYGLGPCPDEFGDFDDLDGACVIGPSFGDDDPESAYLGTQPLALACSDSQIPQAPYDPADLQDGDVDVDCTVIFSKRATGSLSLLMGIEGSSTRVIESLCGERTIAVGGLSIDIDPNLIQGQIDEHLSALEDLGIDTSCVPFLSEANGSFAGNLRGAVDRNACLGFRVRAKGVDFDWGGLGAPEGWQPISVVDGKVGNWIIRFRRDWAIVTSYCHE